MHSWKLMLTALGTAAFLGTVGGTTFAPNPTMKPPPDQPWRQGLGPDEAPTPAYDIVEAGPQDLSPQGLTYGAARAFPQDDVRPSARQLAYRIDDPTLPEDADWSYSADPEEEAVRPSEAAPVAVEVPVIEAAEAARDAARAAQDQGVVPAVAMAGAGL